MRELSPYQKELTIYNYHCEQAAKQGQPVSIPKGLSDVFRVFRKHGARSSMPIISRLEREHDINTFQRGNRRKNFDKVAMWIVANMSLRNRSFSKQGSQQQIADRLGISQATVSRILELMCKMQVLKVVNPNKDEPTSAAAAVVGDKSGIPLNHVYVVQDDFAYLAGPTAGEKMIQAMEDANDKAEQETGWNLKERLMVVRNTLWEGTIKRRIRNISKGCFEKKVKESADRSIAAQIIYNRMKKHEPDLFETGTEALLDKLINARLAACGFAA